jgi:hypothetical protein
VSAIYEDVVALPLLARAVASTNTADFRMLGATGLYILIDVSAVTTGTFTLQIFGKEPFEGNYYQINADLAVAVATGRHHYVVMPGAQRQPAGEGAATASTSLRQFISVPMPDVFRLVLVQSDASSLTYGITFRRMR